MRKLKLFLLLCGVVLIAGCATYHQSPDGTIVTDEVYNTLPAEEQAQYTQEYKAISGPVSEGVTETLTAGRDIAGKFGPIGESVAGLFGLALIIWQGVTQVKLRKGKEELDAVKSGARITADNIEEVFAGASDLWEMFKQRQREAKTKAAIETAVVPIMPDKVVVN